jgi:hypothetical protein
MGLLNWLWPHRPKGRGAVIGDGQFAFRVVGTSFHQGQLEAIAGARKQAGYHRFCAALLARQPNNPHDHGAVAVIIHGVEVGHLDRGSAREFGKVLAASGFVDVACEAEIVGGWLRAGNDWGYVGVRLNANLPFQLCSANEWRQRRRIRGDSGKPAITSRVARRDPLSRATVRSVWRAPSIG